MGGQHSDATVRGFRARLRISSPSLGEVSSIQSGRPDADKEVFRASYRVGDLLELEDFWAAGGGDDNCFHGRKSTRLIGSPHRHVCVQDLRDRTSRLWLARTSARVR